MELIPALGSQDMQDALTSPYVRKTVDGLLQVKGQSLFRLVALFLKNFDYSKSLASSFVMKLQVLKLNHTKRPDADGTFSLPSHAAELLSNVEALYKQSERQVNFQRGAIVELLASELVATRCSVHECYSNYRFLDGRYSSDQVDVAVFSKSREQVEAYTCKLNCMNLTSADCTNLTALADKARDLYYSIHIGAICFDHSSLIEQRIRDRLTDTGISMRFKAYGLDNFLELERSPFIWN